MKINLSNRIKTIIVLTLCVIPSLYLYLIAQDRFQSTSHFSVVVEEDNNAEASMGLLDLVGRHQGRLMIIKLLSALSTRQIYYSISKLISNLSSTIHLHQQILFFVCITVQQ